MWIWSERTYRPTSKKPHGKNPQAIKFLIFSISIFSVLAFWPPFDHYCAITYQNAEKACCDNQQWAFSCFGGKCAEPTKFTFPRLFTPPCRSSPTPGAGGSNPFGRTMTNVLTAFSCQRIFVIFYLLNSDITGGVVHNYAFSCIHRHIGCR